METMETTQVLSGIDICKEFVIKRNFFGHKEKKFEAVHNISMSVKNGETLGIVGESGSGKSTVGEIMGDLQKPTSGSVVYMGMDISKMDSAEYIEYRRNVQFIFQDPKGSMNPRYTIRKILEEPLLTLGIMEQGQEMDKKIESLIAKVGLEKCTINKFPSQLSGGQCQRVAIARAIIVNPKVIVCDEPVSALDVSIQAQILNLLKELQEETGIAYLFISHDIGVVNYMADRIVVMCKGTVVETGSAETVFALPKAAYTRKLIESSFVN